MLSDGVLYLAKRDVDVLQPRKGTCELCLNRSLEVQQILVVCLFLHDFVLWCFNHRFTFPLSLNRRPLIRTGLLFVTSLLLYVRIADLFLDIFSHETVILKCIGLCDDLFVLDGCMLLQFSRVDLRIAGDWHLIGEGGLLEAFHYLFLFVFALLGRC